MPATPQDHKDGTFEWEAPSGDTIHLPALGSIPAGALRKYRKLDEVDFLFSILEDVVDDAELEKIDALSQRDFTTMSTEWQRFEGATFPQS